MSGVAEVREVQEWLRSEWGVQVPPAWLDACVTWIKEEAAGPGPAQALLKRRVLEQWLLTDLRDLALPVLPAGTCEARRTQLTGRYCLQMDSVLDVSRPAYCQLQSLRGADRSNEEVSEVTQVTQRPWEAKPSRLLMLQLTDGVQSLEAMEHRPVPVLHAHLPPGSKLQLSGLIPVRLGVLLLKAENVTVLGGEVEQLLEMFSQGRVLCGALGVPWEDGPSPEPDDQEMLASVADSGFGSMSRRQPRDAVEIPDEDFSDVPEDLESHSHVTRGIRCLQDHVPEQVGSGHQDHVPEDLESHWQVGRGHQDDVPEDLESDWQVGRGHQEDGPEDLDSDWQDDVPEDFDKLPLDELDSVMLPLDSPSTEAPPSGSDQDEAPPQYFCWLQDAPWPPAGVEIEAFVVTLTGSLRSSGGMWKLEATISDGSGYLDVDLSDALLTRLMGFSAGEARVMRRDPARRAEVERGIQRCQRELVDMCGVMSVMRTGHTGRALLLTVTALSRSQCDRLQRRVTRRRSAFNSR